MTCHLCDKPIAAGLDDLSADHVIPRSQGGTDSLENLRPSHRQCNYARQDKSVEEFRALRTDAMKWFESLEA
ncbi:HNH endonuclease [Cellulosimicrobium funkei]|nr:HNH endonuclease [Cellulosimicrobium funkei]